MAVLSYNFWRRHFHGDPDIVGNNIQLVHKNYTILGLCHPASPGGMATSISR